MSSLALTVDVLLLQTNVDQYTNVNKINSDVVMVHVDQVKAIVIQLVILVQSIDHIDVKSEHVPLMLTIAQLKMDVLMNIHKDVQKLDNVQKLKQNVKTITKMSHYQMDVK
jgi:hypothetical protein